MKILIPAILVSLLQTLTVEAQEGAALQQLAAGWARGEWVLLAHVGVNPQTGRWEAVENSPWSRWTVRRVGPRSVEYATHNGLTRVVEFADGRYLDRPPAGGDGSPGEGTEASIVQHGIFGTDNWRILILWPPSPDAPEGPRDYSELIMAGNVFVWTNWTEDADGTRRRVMYSASQAAAR